MTKKHIFLITFFLIMLMIFSSVVTAQQMPGEQQAGRQGQGFFGRLVDTIKSWFGFEQKPRPSREVAEEPYAEEDGFAGREDSAGRESFAEEGISYELGALPEKPLADYQAHYTVGNKPQINFEVTMADGSPAKGSYKITMSHEGGQEKVIDTGILGSDGQASTTASFNKPGTYTFSAFTQDSTKPEARIYVSPEPKKPVDPEDFSITLGDVQEKIDRTSVYGDGSFVIGGEGWVQATPTDPDAAEVKPPEAPAGTPISITGKEGGDRDTEIEITVDGTPIGTMEWNQEPQAPTLEVQEGTLLGCSYEKVPECEPPAEGYTTVEVTQWYKNKGPFPCIPDPERQDKKAGKKKCKGKKITRKCRTKVVMEPEKCPKPSTIYTQDITFKWIKVSTGKPAPCIPPVGVPETIKEITRRCPGKQYPPASEEQQEKWMRYFKRKHFKEWKTENGEKVPVYDWDGIEEAWGDQDQLENTPFPGRN